MTVRRYFSLDWAPRHQPTICDRVWWDRKTGKIVLRYDLADPANRDPDYGATPDRYILDDKGHDVDEKIDEAESVLSPDEARERMENWS